MQEQPKVEKMLEGDAHAGESVTSRDDPGYFTFSVTWKVWMVWKKKKHRKNRQKQSIPHAASAVTAGLREDGACHLGCLPAPRIPGHNTHLNPDDFLPNASPSFFPGLIQYQPCVAITSI